MDYAIVDRLFFHWPRVKSGNFIGRLPCATDFSLSGPGLARKKRHRKLALVDTVLPAAPVAIDVQTGATAAGEPNDSVRANGYWQAR